MNGTFCCLARGTAPNDGPARRWLKAAGSALPGAMVILLPKCPACLAAWIAASTGVALPTMVAGSIRPCLVIACVLSASLLVRCAIGRFRSV
jgi:hypothetical protein